ncbi:MULTISPECIES: hypothetical protein [Sphingomonas]|uniref:hypothetical protein n=1 Tax=Sphingomonas TaxID=13687 RepID=UPI000DF0013F|nr:MULTISPECIES: hypothetical protein [Sphingomonas]
MSDKPLLDRLQVKGERTLAVIGAPPALAALTADARTAEPQDADVVLLFTPDRAVFDQRLPELAATLRRDTILWVAYPKLTSSLAADLSRDLIHQLAPTHGRDTVAQIAIDLDWSALRLKRV